MAGNRHHQNQMLSAAWHAAKMTAYAPDKPRDFVKLEKLLLSDTEKPRARADWRTLLAKMQGWANPKGRK